MANQQKSKSQTPKSEVEIDDLVQRLNDLESKFEGLRDSIDEQALATREMISQLERGLQVFKDETKVVAQVQIDGNISFQDCLRLALDAKVKGHNWTNDKHVLIATREAFDLAVGMHEELVSRFGGSS
jgi:hypothetical protein